MTIKDIAKKANVSIATVSRVLNDSDLVSEETKEHIKKIIKEMDYQPNALARGLVTNKTKVVGVMIPDINNLFYPAVVRGIEDFLEQNDYNTFLCNTDNDIAKEKKYINTLIKNRVEGIILMGTRPIDPKKNEHINGVGTKLPVVMINDYVVGSNVYCVLTDEVEGAYMAVKYLIELGHKKIAYVTGEKDYTTYLNKQIGYEMALREYDIKINPDYIIRDTPYPEGGARAAFKLLYNMDSKPTAIFTGSDQIAMGIMKAAYEMGLKIPEDLSIIGYANMPISADLYPELTTVNQYPYETGKMAADILIRIINGEKLRQKKYIIDPELLVRKSCRSLK